MGFDVKEYWEQRLSANFNLHGVGHLGQGVHYNRWLYRRRKNRLVKLIRTLRIDSSNMDVLDIGSGTGFYIDIWIDMGVRRITGTDITNVAIDKLKIKYADLDFFRVDISSDIKQLIYGKYDIISCIDVFFHIVDDDNYVMAINNIKKLLKPGGIAIITEALPLHKQEGNHFKFRTKERVYNTLSNANLIIKDIQPIFYIMHPPVEYSSEALHILWRILFKILSIHWCIGILLGPIMYLLEMVLMPIKRTSYSSFFIALRKMVKT